MIRNGDRTARRIAIVAGSNGAGKSTLATEFLKAEPAMEFINADIIAAGISPTAVDRIAMMAGRILLTRIAEKLRLGESFAFETTLAGLGYAQHIPRWRKSGYFLKIIFLSLPSADLALSRVRSRAAQGGHDVPEDVVRQRFEAGLRNFERIYAPLVDSWALYDNSGTEPRLLSSGVRG